jgi:hypothetical protein
MAASARYGDRGVNRQQLAHILRSSCQIARDKDVLVIGSQAILGSYDADELPAAVLILMEADGAFLDDPGRRKADAVDGGIGEMSTFHETNLVDAEGVHIDTPNFRQGGAIDSSAGIYDPATQPIHGSSSRMILS